ncbi:hypothetical protein EO244_05510 [Ancylomarina salipaludis]|uniref:DSP-PTPase phosphatase fused to NAD+ Kinase domain-containing protein n=1 Tax=Ancylomarina salipaludis TaxID=2501299 RepID=A0A4Q1JNJ3_9BACT|nr:sulfur transferase domain-containing protein [Ancylomarina salipaludis]RXQ96289.1 hypothetical protein EO244_05510 [Ancylomarina salipaludis]
MKTPIIALMLSLILAFSSQAKNKTVKADSVEIIKDFNSAFKYQNYYISAQPSLEALRWYKSQGVRKIVNLRTEKENQDFATYAYNEENMASELGLDYHNLPIGGNKDYTPENLEAFAKLLEGKEKLLIHCRSAGRVTNVLMAYLIQYKGYSANEAARVGRKLKFALPFEKMLGKEISLEIND